MDGRGGARRPVSMYVRNEIRGVGDEEERGGEGCMNLRAWVGLWICAVGCGWVLVVVSGPTSSRIETTVRTYVRLRNLFEEERRAYRWSDLVFLYMGLGVGVGGCW